MQLTRPQRATLEYIAEEGTCPDHHDLSRYINLAESHDLPETVMGALSLYEEALAKETKAADALSEAKGHKKAIWERVRHVAKNPDGDLVDRAEQAEEDADDLLPEQSKKKGRGRPKKSEQPDVAEQLAESSSEKKRLEKIESDLAEEAATVGGIDIKDDGKVTPMRLLGRTKAMDSIRQNLDWQDCLDHACEGKSPLQADQILLGFEDVEETCLEGFNDYQAGKQINPYDMDDPEEEQLGHAWRNGWNNANRDQMSLESDPEIANPDEIEAATALAEEGDGL